MYISLQLYLTKALEKGNLQKEIGHPLKDKGIKVKVKNGARALVGYPWFCRLMISQAKRLSRSKRNHLFLFPKIRKRTYISEINTV